MAECILELGQKIGIKLMGQYGGKLPELTAYHWNVCNISELTEFKRLTDGIELLIHIDNTHLKLVIKTLLKYSKTIISFRQKCNKNEITFNGKIANITLSMLLSSILPYKLRF